MLLLSVSCSQNDPENAMVFHAIQQPRPRYVKLGACRSMDASAFENRSEALAVVFPCALVSRRVVLLADCHIPPILDWLSCR